MQRPKEKKRKMVLSSMHKNDIATVPILRRFDPVKRAVIIVYASERAISASLLQNHEGLHMPVPYTIRTVKANQAIIVLWKKTCSPD